MTSAVLRWASCVSEEGTTRCASTVGARAITSSGITWSRPSRAACARTARSRCSPARGEAPRGGWRVRVQDLPQPLDAEPDGPAQTVSITGGGLATSSTRARRWAYGAAEMHHLLDPRTGLPAVTPWRTVSAAAATCLEANVATTATIVLGDAGLAHARSTGLAVRLVAADGTTTRTGGWPA